MKPRVVYDTMVFYQWAVLPEGRLHGSARAVINEEVELCLSADLLAEVADLLNRPAIRARSSALTAKGVELFLNSIRQKATSFDPVPGGFSWREHPDDDHVFNLAIAAKARYLVTWENRLLSLPTSNTPAAESLRALAPRLSIITPAPLSEELRKNVGNESR